MGASHDVDNPLDDDREDVLNTLVNLGVSKDTLECVQSDLDVQAVSVYLPQLVIQLQSCVTYSSSYSRLSALFYKDSSLYISI